jgi:hypothetical protein
MEKLEAIIKPIGILTNIGSSHDEGLFRTKIKEKQLLLSMQR